MAMSLGVFSTFMAGDTSSMAKSSSSSLRLVVPVGFQSSPANLRTARTVVTYATVSKQTTEPTKRAVRGIMKPRPVSPELQDFLGGKQEISHTQALKEIWAYIKEKELQDPADKKVIVCDEKLKKILGGKDRVGFLQIAGLLSPHLLKDK